MIYAAAFTGITLASCVHKLRSPEELVVKTWSSKTNATKFPERQLPFFERRKDIGVAFSGGGTRSAACVAGQLRGLKKLKILDQVRYISSVSGGTWGAAPYIFFDSSLTDGKNSRFEIANEAALLGNYRDPGELQPEDFGDTKSNRNRGGYITKAISKSTVTFQALTAGSGDENFATALNDIFLEPFGLGDRNRFVSLDAQTREEILKRNPDKGLLKNDFYLSQLPSTNRPFWIANAYLTTKRSESETLKRFYPIEMTPYYVGSRRSGPDGKMPRFGGGFVESAGYDSINLGAEGDLRRVKISQKKFLPSRLLFPEEPRFSISDILAASGSAPMNVRWVTRVFNNAGFPEFDHWPINNPKQKGDEFLHNDGGAVDNLGIAPLLAREVKTIYAFCNSASPFLPISSQAGKDAERNGQPRTNEMISSLFGVFDKENCPKDPTNWKAQNIVFQNPKDKATGSTPYRDLVAALDAKYEANQPLVHSGTYYTKKNSFFGIEANHQVRVVWFVLGGAGDHYPKKFVGKLFPQKPTGDQLNPWIAKTNWYQDIPAGTRQYLVKKSAGIGQNRALRMFPHVQTFFTNNGRLIDLSRVQAEALAHFTAYAVVENEKLLKGAIPRN